MACEGSKGGSPPGTTVGVRLSTTAFVVLLACVVAPWFFSGHTEESLRRFFGTLNLREEERNSEE